MQGLNRRIDPKPGVKILGERNSGTNFLETLVRDNIPDLRVFDNIPTLPTAESTIYPKGFFPKKQKQAAEEALLDHYHETMLASSGGWKHAAATPQLKDRFFAPTGAAAIIILRHPADWARSMHRNPFHTLCQVPRAFSDFLRQPWLTTARDALPERLVPDLVSLLAGKVDSYLWLLDTWPNSTVIRYEDLAKAPEEVLDHIGLPLPAAFKIPHADPRRFARKKRSNESYGERAAKASYDVLRQTDQQFLRTGLAGGICDRLYPE